MAPRRTVLSQRVVALILTLRRRSNRRAHRRRVRLAIVILAVVTAAVSYVVLMAQWQSAGDSMIDFGDLVVPRATDVLLAAWFFFVGSSIGSFLNVVAWRMPRGMSINGRSHCPRCDAALAWRDNWPVVGWIVLGGRCRNCRLPISPRYPIVEATVGLCVAWVAMRAFYSDATNLPFWPQRYGRATALWVPYLSADSVAAIVYHIAGVSSLWAVGLVRADGNRLPRTLVAWCLAIVAIPMLIVPYLAVVPWTVTEDVKWLASGEYLNAVMRVLTGAAIGVMLARMMQRYICPTADPKLNPLGEGTARLIDLAIILAIAAILVGWQASIGVAAVATLVGGIVPPAFIKDGDPLARLAIGLPIATSIQIAYWSVLHGSGWWPSVNTAPSVTLAWAALVLVLPRMLVTAPRDKATGPERDLAESD
jgi:leader peptidase (prepilin peptidase) / N-methyltransferase